MSNKPDDPRDRTWKAPGLAGSSSPAPPEGTPSFDRHAWSEDRFDVTAKVPREAWPSRAEARHPVLRVAAGPDLLAYVRLEPGKPLIAGRDEQAELRLRDPSVSRSHARFELWGDAEVMVTDLGSTNGVRLDEREIQRGIVVEGARLELGAVSLRLDLMTDAEILHLSKVRARLLQADNRDPLTGLLTRAFLEDELPRMAATCAKASVPLCCLFFDLDHFKRINDNFGHATGDTVLETVAQLALLDCRDTDACLRYGGEEFVIVLQGTEAKDAREAAKRLCRSVQGYDWARNQPGLEVTISCGVAQRRINEDLGAWIGRADRAMYVAKRKGRNRALLAVGD
jgi:diguanylate cyclase (GGDEF)-like protein